MKRKKKEKITELLGDIYEAAQKINAVMYPEDFEGVETEPETVSIPVKPMFYPGFGWFVIPDCTCETYTDPITCEHTKDEPEPEYDFEKIMKGVDGYGFDVRDGANGLILILKRHSASGWTESEYVFKSSGDALEFIGGILEHFDK